MIESIFAAGNPVRASTFQSAPAPARGKSPLEQYLMNQTFGKQIAGNMSSPTQTLAQNAPAYSFHTPAGAAPVAAAQVDPGAITNFYSDPANADYHNDPALLGIKAADATNSANADDAALKSRRGVLAQLGSRGLASTVLGNDDPTLSAVSDDPDASTSILARLANAYRSTVNTNEDTRNKGNLWYSTARAEGLNKDAQDYSTQQADAIANAQATLDQIGSTLAATKGAASQSDASAEQDAFARYLAAVAAHPPSAIPPGGSGAGTGAGPHDLPLPSDGSGGTMPFQGYDGTPVLPSLAGSLEGETGVRPTMAYTSGTPDTGGAPILPSIAAAFEAATGTPLAQFLAPPSQKNPLSGYAAGSGAGQLH